MDAPPLSWSIDTNALPSGPAAFSYNANAEECALLRGYAGVDKVTSFSASVRITRLSGGRFKATGQWDAQLILRSTVKMITEKEKEAVEKEEF